MFHLLFCRSQSLDFSILLYLVDNTDLKNIINDHNREKYNCKNQNSTYRNRFITRLQDPLQIEIIDYNVFFFDPTSCCNLLYNRINIIHRYICRIIYSKINIILSVILCDVLIIKLL